jgi:hypothetical protein
LAAQQLTQNLTKSRDFSLPGSVPAPILTSASMESFRSLHRSGDHPMTRSPVDNRIKNVIRVSSGNFLEMYDFIVFGYYAAAIGHTFFPGNSPYGCL